MISVTYGYALRAGNDIETSTTQQIETLFKQEGIGRKIVHKHYGQGGANLQFEPERLPQKTYDLLLPILMNIAGKNGVVTGILLEESAAIE